MVDRQQARKSLYVSVQDVNTGDIKRIAFTENVQIGLPGEPGELVLTGRLSVPTRSVSIDPTLVLNSSVSMTNDDCVLCVTTPSSSTPCTVVLPVLPRDGQLAFVADAGGCAGLDSIVVTPGNPASQTIDGGQSVTIMVDHGNLCACWTSDGWKTISSRLTSSSGGGGGGAPTDAQYVTMALNGTLTDERVLTSGTGLNLTDGGAGGNATLSVDDDVVATVSGTIFSGRTKHMSGITGSIQKLVDGTSFVVAGSGVSVVSGSNGSILVSLEDRRTDMSNELLWYKFNETSGDILNQGTGGSLPLSSSSGIVSTLSVPDIFGDALALKSGDSYHSAKTTSVVPDGTHCSIWSIVRRNSYTAGASCRVWGFSNDTVSATSYFEMWDVSDLVTLYYRLTSGPTLYTLTAISGQNTLEGLPNLCFATYDGAVGAKLYWNGYLVASDTNTGVVDFTQSDCRWGVGKSYGGSFDGIAGNVLDVGCADRVVTAAEIKLMYSKILR